MFVVFSVYYLTKMKLSHCSSDISNFETSEMIHKTGIKKQITQYSMCALHCSTSFGQLTTTNTQRKKSIYGMLKVIGYILLFVVLLSHREPYKFERMYQIAPRPLDQLILLLPLRLIPAQCLRLSACF